jgi:hypothetical protein
VPDDVRKRADSKVVRLYANACETTDLEVTGADGCDVGVEDDAGDAGDGGDDGDDDVADGVDERADG